MSIDQYSNTPASNDLSNYFQTGMRPSAVKNAGWDIMADTASYLVSLPAAGGTANALTVANGRPFGSLVAGLMQILNPGTSNTGPATFAADGLTAEAVFTNGAVLAGGELQAGVPAFLKYDGTQWNLLEPTARRQELPGGSLLPGGAGGGGDADAPAMPMGWWTWCSARPRALRLAQAASPRTASTPSPLRPRPIAQDRRCDPHGHGKVFFRRWVESRDAIAFKNLHGDVLACWCGRTRAARSTPS